MSEDCLYLNVWTPAKSASDRVPVLVWIHGGGFSAGATSEPNYSGERLARKGMVLVSITYRIGTLGFLAHPELSAEKKEHASGNYGLLDMIAGLEWVRKTIAALGGDPRRVTIFGESAGGIAVSMLCASPLAKGLFHGAISQSGGAFGPPRPTLFPGENLKRLADAERSGETYAASAGSTSIAGLRKISADKLPAAGPGGGVPWPIIDGWVIPDDQYKLYEAKRYNDTPILVGYNSDEGATFFLPRTPEDYIAAVKAHYGPFADRLLKAYPTDATTVPKTARDLTRVAAFGCHTWVWRGCRPKRGNPTLSITTSTKTRIIRPVRRAAPMCRTCSSISIGRIRRSRSGTRQSRRPMATYWTNFAKRGAPNGDGLPSWPAFSDANPVVMYFSQTLHTGPVPGAEALKVLGEYCAQRRTPEGAARANQTKTAGASRGRY